MIAIDDDFCQPVQLFFFNVAATTEIYTLSLHDALPICPSFGTRWRPLPTAGVSVATRSSVDRKSTRLNSSHLVISYAVFCLKKKKKRQHLTWNGEDFDFRSKQQMKHMSMRSDDAIKCIE